MTTKLSPSDYAIIVDGYIDLMTSMDDEDLQEFHQKMSNAYYSETLDFDIWSEIDRYYEERSYSFANNAFDDAREDFPHLF